MMRRHPAWEPLFEAELDVADVTRWARVLIAMGSCDNHIHAGAAFVIGQALEALGDRLEGRWRDALEAARAEGGR